jgi:hypothetical protein
MNITITALHDLDKVLCMAMLNAVDTLLNTALDALPGGLEIEAAERLVEGAKTFVENGLDATSFFTSWVNKACNAPPEWPGGFDGMMGELVAVPDSWGTSKGCNRKSGCKPLPPPTRKDPPPDKSKPTEAPKPEPTDGPPRVSETKPADTKPTATKPAESTELRPSSKSDPPKSSTSADAHSTTRPSTSGSSSSGLSSSSSVAMCTKGKSNKRGGKAPPGDKPGPAGKGKSKPGAARQGKLGEPETNMGGCDGKETHITSTKPSFGTTDVLIGTSCPKKHTQACYHYR